jgi:hypothetical protein
MHELGDEVYNLSDDHGEHKNLASDSTLRNELGALLDAHVNSDAADLGLSVKGDLDEAERARIEKEMRDLGYM